MSLSQSLDFDFGAWHLQQKVIPPYLDPPSTLYQTLNARYLGPKNPNLRVQGGSCIWRSFSTKQALLTIKP